MKIKLIIAVIIALIILPTVACSKASEEGALEGYYLDGSDLHITESGARIKDMNIVGDLYIDESVGDGEFYVEECEIEGNIYVNGGGPNSGYLINVIGKTLFIENETNSKIVLGMNTNIEGVQIASDCHLVTDGNGVKQVRINNSKAQNAINVLMTGEYPEVSIESTANVKIDGKVSLMTVLKKASMTSIEMVDTSKVYFYSCYGNSVTISGGTIIEAWINAEYCSLPEDTGLVYSEVGVASVTVGDVDMSIIPTKKPESEEKEPANKESEPQTNGAEPDSNNTPSDDADSNKTPGDDTEPNNTSDEKTITKDDDQSNQVDDFVDASKPTFSSNGTKKTIGVIVNEPCKVYVMVEGEPYFNSGSTAEKVRDGVSAGANNPEYTVIYVSFDAKVLNSKLNFVVDMKNYGLDEGGFGEGVFVVLEDGAGNLTQVYSFK